MREPRSGGGSPGLARPGFPTVGILGGGQLGRMLIYRAKKLGMSVAVLDESPDAPAARLADRFVQGSLYDASAIRKLAEGCDVVTCEIEHLDTAALGELERSGVVVHPSSLVLSAIQDKYRQKRLLSDAGVPVPRFVSLTESDEADPMRTIARIREFGLPCVQKLRTGGYDGRGVLVIQGEKELAGLLKGSTMIEEHVAVEAEIAVIVARGRDASVATFPVVGMRFLTGANILEWLEAPADIDAQCAARATAIARRAVEALDGAGVFAVELFVTAAGEIFVNEVAPRPHNSGHFTIEACLTDQFEQHLRAICGLPLGATGQLAPAVMLNLLGDVGSRGVPIVEGLNEALALPGVSFHWYGKTDTRPHRKMGHITVLAATIEQARRTAARVKELVRVRGEERDGETHRD